MVKLLATFSVPTPRVNAFAVFVLLLERAAGAVFLIAVSPVIAASAGIISLLSRRSPFIAHQRVGEALDTAIRH